MNRRGFFGVFAKGAAATVAASAVPAAKPYIEFAPIEIHGSDYLTHNVVSVVPDITTTGLSSLRIMRDEAQARGVRSKS